MPEPNPGLPFTHGPASGALLQQNPSSRFAAPADSMPRLALLAGGLGKRMHPATTRIAKSMLPVAGSPFIGHQLRMLASQAIGTVVICCGHLEEQIRDYVGDGSEFGCAVEYSPDGIEPLGTGGALRKALPLLGKSFLVMYGDSFLPVSIKPVWRSFQESGKQALMTVYHNLDQWDKSNVEFLNGAIVSYNKHARNQRMQHIDYGLSCMSAEVLENWPEYVRFDLADVTEMLIEHGELAGFEVSERFYEIGSPAGLAETDALLRSWAARGNREAGKAP
jgi:NDP-sugar pyrophosphorylase family protein